LGGVGTSAARPDAAALLLTGTGKRDMMVDLQNISIPKVESAIDAFAFAPLQ
jgi:hypothetical protein